MLSEDYQALKAMLEEFQEKRETVTAESDLAYRRIREADALILALTEVEPDDMRVFSPRRSEGRSREKIEEICQEREAYEERCKVLKEQESFFSRHISMLEGILSHQKVEVSREQESGREDPWKATAQADRTWDAEPEPDENELPEGKEKLDSLTERERQILCQVAEGMLNKEIAAALDISEQTVKNHISSIFQKLDVADRTQAAVFAIKNGLEG